MAEMGGSEFWRADQGSVLDVLNSERHPNG